MQQHSHQPAGLGDPGLTRAFSAGPSVSFEGLQDVELSVSSRQQHMRHNGGGLLLSEPQMAAIKSQLLQATEDADSPAAVFTTSNTYLMFLAAQQASTARSSCTSQPSSTSRSSSSSGIDASEKPLTAEDAMQLRLKLCRALSEPVWEVAIAEARAKADCADATLGSIKAAAAAASAVVASVAPGGGGYAAATAAPVATPHLLPPRSSGGGGGQATCMRAHSNSLAPMQQQQQQGSLARTGSTIKLVFEPIRKRSATKKGGRLGRHLQVRTGATGSQGRLHIAWATAAAPAARQPLQGLPGASPARFTTASPPAAQPLRVPDIAAATFAAASARPLRAPGAGRLTAAVVTPSLPAHDAAACNFAAAAASIVPAPGAAAAAAAAIAAAKRRESCRAIVMAVLQQQRATGMVGCKRSHSCMEPACHASAGPRVTSSTRSMC